MDLESLQKSIEAIDHELKSSVLQTKSLEAEAQAESSSFYQEVPQIDPRTHATTQLLQDGTDETYALHKQQYQRGKHLGTSISPHYEPHMLINNPPRPSQITLELLLASQAHMGHKTSHWNPGNSRYIFGIRQGIHIISLDIIAAHLRRACRIVTGVAERGGIILFVGTRPGQDLCVVQAAKMAGACHLFDRWTPGSITNGHQILGSCQKKVVDEFDREVKGQEGMLADEPAIKPDLVIVLNPLENSVLLHECGLNAIPTIGIIDTNADPTWVTYPIPANDDSMRCVQVIAGVLGRAGQEGQARRKELAASGIVTYTPIHLGDEEDNPRSARV